MPGIPCNIGATRCRRAFELCSSITPSGNARPQPRAAGRPNYNLAQCPNAIPAVWIKHTACGNHRRGEARLLDAASDRCVRLERRQPGRRQLGEERAIGMDAVGEQCRLKAALDETMANCDQLTTIAQGRLAARDLNVGPRPEVSAIRSMRRNTASIGRSFTASELSDR